MIGSPTNARLNVEQWHDVSKRLSVNYQECLELAVNEIR